VIARKPNNPLHNSVYTKAELALISSFVILIASYVGRPEILVKVVTGNELMNDSVVNVMFGVGGWWGGIGGASVVF